MKRWMYVGGFLVVVAAAVYFFAQSPPPAPTNFRIYLPEYPYISHPKAATYNLDWDPVSGATGYHTYYKDGSLNPPVYIPTQAPGNSISVIHPGLGYDLVIRAYNAVGESPDSNVLHIDGTVGTGTSKGPLPFTGARDFAVALIKFPDYGEAGTWTPTSIQTFASDLAAIYSTNSWGQLTYTPHTYGWLTMPHPITYYVDAAIAHPEPRPIPAYVAGKGYIPFQKLTGNNQDQTWLNEEFLPELIDDLHATVNAAYNANSMTFNVLIVAGVGDCSYNGGHGVLGYFDPLLMSAETAGCATPTVIQALSIGKSLFADDDIGYWAHAPTVTTDAGPDDTYLLTGGFSTHGGFSATWGDVMMARGKEPGVTNISLIHRMLAGWLPLTSIRDVSASGTHTVKVTNEALTPSTPHLLRVHVPPAQTYYAVEMRAGGYMSVLLHNMACLTPGTGVFANPAFYVGGNGQFLPGETFVDPYRNVTIKLNTFSGTEGSVIVTYGALGLALPISDASPNGYSPVPSGPHYQKVDEEVQNGDTDYLTVYANQSESFGLSTAALTDYVNYSKVTITWTAKNDGNSDSTAKVGFKIGGVDYWAASHSVPNHSPWDTFTDTWTTDPSCSCAWTKARITAALARHASVSQSGLPRPKLTQLIVKAYP